jgi:hypothetical protein
LNECFDSPEFDEAAFVTAGVDMLDGVKAFWDGLYDDARKQKETIAAA